MPNISPLVGEYIAIILISAFALMLVTNMLNMRMTSQGIPKSRKRGLIAEVWITFAIIISVFCYTSRIIPPRINRDLFADLFNLSTLPADKLTVVIIAFVIALIAFIRLITNIRKVDSGELMTQEITNDNDIEK
ncbi:MAG: hypothetical protein WCO98_12685 [bacterium]